ncbi:MAG: TlpA family protein disulfide reductase [Planctomycetota bacterium]|jgi:thiol-disulfide isomerase/thioredoxin
MRLKRVLLVLTILFLSRTAFTQGLVGKKAPSFEVKRWLTPKPPKKTDFVARVYVLEFSATWCMPCVYAVPHLKELNDIYSPKGVLLVSLFSDKSDMLVRSFIQRMDIDYNVGMDDSGIPQAYVISHTGTILWQGHPMDGNFERAIAEAVQAAPPPFLFGIDLGPFESLKPKLMGGREFPEAYAGLQLEQNGKDPQKAKAAAEILKEINRLIKEQLNQAKTLKQAEPLEAYELYEIIVNNYQPIEAVEKAKAEYEKLKNSPRIKNELAAIEQLNVLEDKFMELKPCRYCAGFNPKCEKCRDSNRDKIKFINEKLLEINSKYEKTKAADTARMVLEMLNPGKNPLDETKGADQTGQSKKRDMPRPSR